MNDFRKNLAGTAARRRSERHLDAVRQQGGMFVEAVRLTRMPMLMTDPTLPGNPIIFANDAFLRLAGYGREEVLGRNCRFLSGPETDPEIRSRVRRAVDDPLVGDRRVDGDRVGAGAERRLRCASTRRDEAWWCEGEHVGKGPVVGFDVDQRTECARSLGQARAGSVRGE